MFKFLYTKNKSHYNFSTVTSCSIVFVCACWYDLEFCDSLIFKGPNRLELQRGI